MGLSPFLKWAGGKRRLLSRILPLLPTATGRYIEPFLGGGAVFLAAKPDRALLSDANPELINTFAALKDDWERVVHLLSEHAAKHSEEYYYQLRRCIPEDCFAAAARFIYLNRTCWNGLYRVNRKGEFNVPVGSRDSVLRDEDNFAGIAVALQSAQLLVSDFQAVVESAGAGDVVFLDPPYTVRHNSNNFIKYNRRLFSWDDQVRLRDCLLEARGRGAAFVLTNADHPSVIRLYRHEGVVVERVERESLIAGKSSKRGKTTELIIRSIS